MRDEQQLGLNRGRLVQDAVVFAQVVIGCVLLGAPAGLLWAHLAPRLTVTVTADGIQADDVESTKAFIGADGSYLVVMLVLGVLCGVLAWWLARRSGPVTVLALAVGGSLAALIAASVGLRPGATHAIQALTQGSPFRGQIPLYLGIREGHTLSLRAPWAFVGWPAGACLAFLVAALRRPEQLD